MLGFGLIILLILQYIYFVRNARIDGKENKMAHNRGSMKTIDKLLVIIACIIMLGSVALLGVL